MVTGKAIGVSLLVHMSVLAGMFICYQLPESRVEPVTWVTLSTTDTQVQSAPSPVPLKAQYHEESEFSSGPTEKNSEPKDSMQTNNDANETNSTDNTQVVMNDFTRAIMVQQMAQKSAVYARMAATTIRSALNDAIKQNSKNVTARGIVTLSFCDDKSVTASISGNESTVAVEQLSSNIDWSAIPSPSAHSLPFTKIIIAITISNNKSDVSLRFA